MGGGEGFLLVGGKLILVRAKLVLVRYKLVLVRGKLVLVRGKLVLPKTSNYKLISIEGHSGNIIRTGILWPVSQISPECTGKVRCYSFPCTSLELLL